MQSAPSTIVVLGTGGTIAGAAADASDHLAYRAGTVAVAELVGRVPVPVGFTLEAEQVAQLDSKDMDHPTWLALARRCAFHLARPEAAGLVVTHGTDTLEETAWFLQRVLAPTRPVVLVSAMRPATALQADGPQNLADAFVVATSADARGVVAVLAGRVFGARDLRKLHSYRLDAFGAGDAGPLGTVEAGRLRLVRDWPSDVALIEAAALPDDTTRWPRVAIVASHAGVDELVVQALRAAPVHGLVVAATGNGSVHRALEAALLDAQRDGIAVMRSTRCANGRVLDAGVPALPSADDLTPPKARVELLLRLLAGSA